MQESERGQTWQKSAGIVNDMKEVERKLSGIARDLDLLHCTQTCSPHPLREHLCLAQCSHERLSRS